MNIGYVADRDGGVEYHRLIRPFEHLAATGIDVTRYNAIPLANVPDVDVDCVVFNRHLAGDETGEVIKALQAKGIRVICDVDDYWVLPSSHLLYRAHKVITPKIARSVQYADAVWCTHETLADRCRPLNLNVTVIPNAIALEDEQWQVSDMPPVKTIGYIAGATHVPDLAETIGAWGAWSGNRMLCGLTDSNAGEFTVMAAIMSEKGRLPFEVAKAMDVWNYGRFYDHISVAVAPLANTAFNRCKSNLKILEAGAKGRPILAQVMHPYVPFDCDGVIHVKDWPKAIKEADHMPMDEIVHRGAALRLHIEKHYSLTQVNELRRQHLISF